MGSQLAQERDHEERQRDFKQLMTWQVLTQGKMDTVREEIAHERQRLDPGLALGKNRQEHRGPDQRHHEDHSGRLEQSRNTEATALPFPLAFVSLWSARDQGLLRNFLWLLPKAHPTIELPNDGGRRVKHTSLL